MTHMSAQTARTGVDALAVMASLVVVLPVFGLTMPPADTLRMGRAVPLSALVALWPGIVLRSVPWTQSEERHGHPG